MSSGDVDDDEDDDDVSREQWLMILRYLSETGSQWGNRYKPKTSKIPPEYANPASAN